MFSLILKGINFVYNVKITVSRVLRFVANDPVNTNINNANNNEVTLQ